MDKPKLKIFFDTHCRIEQVKACIDWYFKYKWFMSSFVNDYPKYKSSFKFYYDDNNKLIGVELKEGNYDDWLLKKAFEDLYKESD